MIQVCWGEPDNMTKAEQKLWGETTLLIASPFVEVRHISVEPNTCCSTHRHDRKHNAFFVLSGELTVEVHFPDGSMSSRPLHAGDYTVVDPGQWHRFVCYGEPATALELYFPAELGEDIVRRDKGGSIGRESPLETLRRFARLEGKAVGNAVRALSVAVMFFAGGAQAEQLPEGCCILRFSTYSTLLRDSIWRIPDPVPAPRAAPPLGMQPYPEPSADLDFWQAHPDYFAQVLRINGPR